MTFCPCFQRKHLELQLRLLTFCIPWLHQAQSYGYFPRHSRNCQQVLPKAIVVGRLRLHLCLWDIVMDRGMDL